MLKINKGFTLMEIIVTLTILGVLTSVAVPVYTNVMQNQANEATKNNLIQVMNAQKNYYFNHGYYCINSGTNPTCGDKLSHLKFNLNIPNLTDTVYPNYYCSAGDTAGSIFCQALNSQHPNDTSYVWPCQKIGETECHYNCKPDCTNTACGQSDGCTGTCPGVCNITGTSCVLSNNTYNCCKPTCTDGKCHPNAYSDGCGNNTNCPATPSSCAANQTCICSSDNTQLLVSNKSCPSCIDNNNSANYSWCSVSCQSSNNDVCYNGSCCHRTCGKMWSGAGSTYGVANTSPIVCGDDGCGGSCGTCSGAGQFCDWWGHCQSAGCDSSRNPTGCSNNQYCAQYGWHFGDPSTPSTSGGVCVNCPDTSNWTCGVDPCTHIDRGCNAQNNCCTDQTHSCSISATINSSTSQVTYKTTCLTSSCATSNCSTSPYWDNLHKNMCQANCASPNQCINNKCNCVPNCNDGKCHASAYSDGCRTGGVDNTNCPANCVGSCNDSGQCSSCIPNCSRWSDVDYQSNCPNYTCKANCPTSALDREHNKCNSTCQVACGGCHATPYTDANSCAPFDCKANCTTPDHCSSSGVCITPNDE